MSAYNYGQCRWSVERLASCMDIQIEIWCILYKYGI